MRVFSLFLTCVLCVMLGLSAHAATFTVTSTADTDGSTCGITCTLRQAVNAAGDDTIAFDPTVFATPQTIALNSSAYNSVVLYTDITITGSTAGVTISNSGQYAPGLGLSGGTVKLVNLTFANSYIFV